MPPVQANRLLLALRNLAICPAVGAGGPGPTFGQDNRPLLQELLGLDEAIYQGLLDGTIITNTPTSGDASPQMEPSRAVELGLLADYDPDYLQRLGLT